MFLEDSTIEVFVVLIFCVEKGLSHNKFYLCLYFYNLWQSNTYYCVYCVQIALCAWFAGLERACIERRSKCSVFIARKSARMLQCSIKNYININGDNREHCAGEV